uniref:Xyloglucan galactosyltransferase KATAMARI1-like protein n=1 Tax=Aegilops tauschii TaxID=37682 RepID=M8BWF6_AEGTA
MKPFSGSTERCARTFYVAVLLSVVLWALIFYSTSLLQSGDALSKPPAFFSPRSGRPDPACAGRSWPGRAACAGWSAGGYGASPAGAPPGGGGRKRLVERRGGASRCALLGKAAVTKSPGEYTQGEYSPSHAMRLLESAEFCIQPRGDSYTRKSIFDTILAGCIPVFLHPISAYVQYTWYLPRDYRAYSVFIPQRDVIGRNASIEEVLRKIPPAKVARMREEVIRLIPAVMYREPAAKGVQFKDAFDVAVERVVDRVAKRRRAAAEGRECRDSVDGYDSWKYNLLEDGQTEIGPHEFDPYMSM